MEHVPPNPSTGATAGPPPGRARGAGDRLARSSFGTRRVCLLDVDPSLASTVAPAHHADVRTALVLHAFGAAAGPWTPAAFRRQASVRGDLLGVAVVEGTLSTTMRLGGRRCSRLMTAGDLVLFGGDDHHASLRSASTWSAGSGLVLAALDERVLLAVARWPRLLAGITRRIAMQTQRSFRSQSISQLPRVEDRLIGALWNLADEIGHVRVDGVLIELPLTHEMLGQMIGARRPTVSLGLQHLANERLIKREGSGWLLSRASLARFETLRDGVDALTDNSSDRVT